MSKIMWFGILETDVRNKEMTKKTILLFMREITGNIALYRETEEDFS